MLEIHKLYDLTAVRIKDVSLRMLGAAQTERPEAIVAAITVLLLELCRRYHVDVRRVLDVTERVLRDAKDRHPVEMRAMARYLREELPDA